jgi:probable rRNA maturation factor
MHRRTRIILSALKHPEAELSILLVDDPRIEALNQRFLSREGPTNVIAFPMREGPFSDLTPALLGDVVISVDTAHREARAAGLSLDQRITQLLVHGILHLCGYDHEHDAAKARSMAVKARTLLKLLEDSSTMVARNPQAKRVKPKTVKPKNLGG